jgi:hypothetical protein
MSSAIVHHSASSIVKTSTGGRSKSSADISWTAAAVTWAHHPLKQAPTAGALAGTVIQLQGVRISSETTAVQTRIGFRTYIDRVMTVRFERKLQRTNGGSYSPTGGWITVDVTEHKTVTPPTRTKGVVPAGELTTTEPAPSGATPSREAASALDAESYLPTAVRKTLHHGQPQPDTHIGSFLLLSIGAATEQAIQVLRMNTSGAEIISATRPNKPTAPWAVQQLSYRFTPTNHALNQ